MKQLGAGPIAVLVLVVATVRYGLGQAFGDALYGQLALDAVALVGTLSAAFSFDREDPPRRAWLLVSLALGMLALGHILDPLLPPDGSLRARDVVVSGANIVWVVAMIVFVRMMTAIDLSERRRDAIDIATIVVAVAAAAFILYTIITPLLRDGIPNAEAWGVAQKRFISVTSDAILFVGAIRLARIAATMRGGAAAEPFALFAFGAASFLVFDAVLALAGASGWGKLPPVSQIPFASAWACFAVAGWLQFRLVRQARRAIAG